MTRGSGKGWQVETPTQASRIAGVAAISFPAFAGLGPVQDLSFILTMPVLAQFRNLLGGYGGQLSVAWQAFAGIRTFAPSGTVIPRRVDPVLAIPLGGLAAVALAVPTAFFAFQLAGDDCASGTWVIDEVARRSIAQWKALGGGTGTSLPRGALAGMWGVETIATLFDVRRGGARHPCVLAGAGGGDRGRHLLASASPPAPRACRRARQRRGHGRDGGGCARMKWRVFLIAAYGAGDTGSFIHVQTARISPDAAFRVVDWTARVIFIVVIGGIGTIKGPNTWVLVSFALPSVFADRGSWSRHALGLIAVVVMPVAPGGLRGRLSDRTGIQLCPVRRRPTGLSLDTCGTTAGEAPNARHHD